MQSLTRANLPISPLPSMHRAPAAMETKPVKMETRTPRDPNTLSNYHNYVTRHTSLDFEIEFERKRLVGSVVLRMESLTDAEVDVVLDSSFLDVSAIKVDRQSAEFSIGERIEPYGSPLTIKLPAAVPKGKTVEIELTVATTEKCTALQWMEPAQTSNKKHPYMFSQCQANHARSVFPCQDTPDVKSTFSFALRSPLPVLASGLPTGASKYQPAKKDGASGTLKYTFEQPVAITSYLMAVASGDLACASIGPRSTVWSGPEELLECQQELEGEIEPFMKAIESIVKPTYQWTQYNVLILPPSFPYGGMENPVWTYATPSIISGDKQNIDVIAHELSHSWSGNLVSAASWEHFWLNEGWTTYLERRIQGVLHGESHRHFSAIIGWKALEESIERYGADHDFTKLVIDLKGKDPDDAFSSIPYEKGFHALYQFELLLGKDKWDNFIPHYFETFKFKSIDSYDFKACLIDFFAKDTEANKKLAEFDWDKLFYAPGYPPKPDFDQTMVKSCYKLADKWQYLITNNSSSDFKPHHSDVADWVSNQSVVFLEKVQSFAEKFSAEQIHLLGHTYGYDKTQNIEVLSRYLSAGLMAKAPETYQPSAELLGRIGRMKFVRPMYRLLEKADRKLAVETFEKNKDFYHPICRSMVEKDLFGDEKK
ncbi:leucine aminopeptidase [Parastagonospora nodorum]|nr:leucine aminopeptidase [Parastagonospora nodorum]KAH3927447.1 leucine aminopeptidase [Parastagonospora nodorum]KAH4069690.1 leucine aminopeptidase [Parastagonospora nodorum]KAH4090099.1 leucine aminopeptidase [Parastagonospora nodorum]KAH4202077.1 leucine aminopeptidase [Parastagonospora nodorum]